MRRTGRQVVLHAHLSRAAVTGRCDCGCECRPDPDEVGLARLDARGSHGARGPLTAAQVREWCATAAAITIRPVLDLAEAIHCDSYEASTRLREQTRNAT